MKNKIAHIAATYLGLGYSPKAPGTAGSLGTLPLAFVLAYFYGTVGILIAAAIIFFIGVWATNEVIKNQENKDPSIVVIDEVVGQLLTFTIVAPSLYQNLNLWYIYIIGFGLFRCFDIVKLGPVKWADTKLKNAWGVMLDDVFAGMLAAVVLTFIAQMI